MTDKGFQRILDEFSATMRDDNLRYYATLAAELEEQNERLLDMLASTEDALWRDDVKAVLREYAFIERGGRWVKK